MKATNEEILARVEKELVEGGRLGFINARRRLLEEAFFKSKDPALQAEFHRRFPPSKELEHELETSLRDVIDGDVPTRRKAAAYLEKQSRWDMNIPRECWVRHPLTMSIFCQALGDPDPDVAEKMAMAIGHVAERYGYDDLEVFARLAEAFRGADKLVRAAIARAATAFPTPAKWPMFLEAWRSNPPKLQRVRLAHGIFVHGEGMPEDMRQQLQAELLLALDSERVEDVRDNIINALERVGDRAAADRLRLLRVPAREKHRKATVEEAIRVIEARASGAKVE